MNVVEKATSNSDRPAPPGQDSVSSLSRSGERKMAGTKFNNAVPRKATKDSHESCGFNRHESDEEVMAPLGFEPEGSATPPNFCEGCSSLQFLLSDRSGYEIFYEYVRLQNYESLLDFWRSCDKFRQLAKDRSNLAVATANTIYNKYMHKKDMCGSLIDDTIRARVKHKLNSGQPLNDSVFDSAQEAISSYINEHFYNSFIRSDVYKCFAGESLKAGNKDRVSSGRSARFAGTALPSLPEEKVLEGDPNNGQWTPGCETRSLGRPADSQKESYVLKKLSKGAIAGMLCQPAPPVVSVNDSDVQSLSSDALTDDSKSTFTDFSDMTSKSVEKKRRLQELNVAGFVPRTKRLPKGCKQLPPEEFAKILIEKLEKVQIERAQEERAAVNLASLPREHIQENKKSILQDAAERHYQLAGRLDLVGIPAQKFNEPWYTLRGNSSVISSSSHVHYNVEQQCLPMPSRYFPNMENIDNANGTWRGCITDKMVDNAQCAPLVNTKKQWESVGTIESAPDSGVCVEEDHSLPPEARNRILKWMEQGEKEAPPRLQQPAKNTRTKHAAAHTGITEQCTLHMQSMTRDPHMLPLTQPDSRNTLEEASRRLAQKNNREKRSKSHHRSRPGYTSSRSSQMPGPRFSGDSADGSSSAISGDYHAAHMYSSSSVLSSVPSTANSNDSGLGTTQKKNKRQPEGTKIVWHIAGEDIPFQSSLPGNVILLGQFKELMSFKKGNFKYFFKRKSTEETCGAVFEEVMEDDDQLPSFDGKITCKVIKFSL